MKNLQKIELLNFEGPVLMAHKKKDTFIITDQWKEIVDVLSAQEIKDFISGKIDITDSRQRTWSYTAQHEDSKQPIEKINSFINSVKVESNWNSNIY
jgi:hypothetical protein